MSDIDNAIDNAMWEYVKKYMDEAYDPTYTKDIPCMNVTFQYEWDEWEN